MSKQKQFDLAALSVVKPSIDEALGVVSARLVQYFDAPGTNEIALEEARVELHRVQGVLRMIALEGVAVYCAEIELVLTELAANNRLASLLYSDVLQRALAGLVDYLDALMQGAHNATLRLFPKYEAMQHLRGLEMAFEQDLFFPNLQVQLPAGVLNIAKPDNAAAVIKAAHSQYQRGLMLWWKSDDVEAAFPLLQQAIEMVLACESQDGSRAFWWIANGLLDCVRLDGTQPNLSVRKLLGRIERKMRAVGKSSAADESSVLNEMLYLLTRSLITSDRVEQIKQCYALAEYQAEPSCMTPAEAKKSLEEVRGQMAEAEDNWQHCVVGDKDACIKFVEYIEKIAQKSDQLDRNTPRPLTRKIADLAVYLRDPAYAQLIGEDVAMALMLWRSGMAQYDTLDTRFRTQARALFEQLHEAMRQQPEATQRLSKMLGLYNLAEQGAVTSSLANEMLTNLQHVEQWLNTFFADASNQAELPSLQRLLGQISGGLRISLLVQAEQLLLEIQLWVNSFSKDEVVKPAVKQALASAVSALHEYLKQLGHGKQDQTTNLSDALVELLGLRQVAAPLSAVSVAPVLIDSVLNEAATVLAKEEPTELVAVPVTPDAKRPQGEDAELLDIFLEEADEVLRIMRNTVEISQLNLAKLEPLITLRRGFHTLKGSGRMVGLTDLGEVAWAVEQAMNKWVEEKKPASAGLLQFVEAAVHAFARWVSDLTRQGYAVIEASELVARAQQIENGIDGVVPVSVESVPAPEASSELPEEPMQPIESTDVFEFVENIAADAECEECELDFEEPESVLIGEIALSPTLFKIASEEASQNVQVLRGQLETMCTTTPLRVQYDFMRAAHTLLGVNRSMGFTAVVELAGALEGWLQAHMDRSVHISEQQLEMLDQAIEALDEMVQSICARKMPLQHDDLVKTLHGDTDKVISEIEADAQRAELEEAKGQVELESIEEVAPLAGVEPLVERAEIAKVSVAAPVLLRTQVEVITTHDIDNRLVLRDDVDAQLLPIFLEEANDLCPRIGESLRAMRKAPNDVSQLQLLNRLLHTLKGSARMTGAMRMGDIAHAMEERLLVDDKTPSALWDGLESDFDRINALLEELRTGKGLVPVADESKDAAGDEEVDARDRHSTSSDTDRAPLANMLRVRSDVIDRLVNDAGEISVARSRMETELRAFKDGLLELTGSVTRLRKQLREVEIQAESQMQARVSLSSESNEQFDPLEFDRFTRLQELTRFMNESVHDVQTVQQSLLKNIDETNAAISAQARLNRELQQNLMNVRMVPFGSMRERLYRLVRQTAKELNKRANLELSGTAVELDRSVLEKMTAPFEHLLRNAIAHGLEDEAARVTSGKDAIGEVRLSLRQESNEVVFEFSDDGNGLNFAALRETAISKGLLEASDETVSEDQLAQMIFTSGVSTASEVTEVAGRGIGMDVVRSEITALGGRIDVSSHAGQGTKFTIHLPLTLAVTQVLMVRAGDATYAIPSTMVAQVRQVKPAVLQALYAEQQLEWEGKTYPFMYLPTLLGDDERAPESQPHNPLLLLRSANQYIALHVDELIGNREAVVKNIGPQLARLPGIAGATVSGAGAVVLILNPLQMTRRLTNVPMARKTEQVVLRVQPMVMVVDDSLTVRKITTRLLTRAGYQVVTAKDGVDALEQLTEFTPDIMLLDVEMPRMDGFELTKLLRRDDKTKALPIIMITSRTADKHRDFAMQLGVNVYLGKPFQEDELLAQIARLIAVPENIAA